MGGTKAAKVEEEEENANPAEVLREYFKGRSNQEHIADFAMSHTLGKGTYGRVRLAESPGVKGKFGGKPNYTPFFAIKILKKSEIIRLKQNEHVKAERDLLLNKVTHPFIVTVYGTYKDERNLFMIQEYVPGGEVLSQCRRDMSKLENDTTKFYAAQLVMALQYLHADNIVFRGLVPDNLLIEKTGYLKLVDFGFAKHVKPDADGNPGLTYTLCGTAEYLAPEIVNSKGHGKGADWWALGVVIYEMLAGYPPFYANSPFEIYQQILKAQPMYPSHFDLNLYEGITPATGQAAPGVPPQQWASRTGLLTRLLQQDRAKRIGCLKNGAEDIKKHKWFRGLNWAALYNKNMPPPSGQPALSGDDDHTCFPTYPDSVEESGPFLEPAKQALFDYWVN